MEAGRKILLPQPRLRQSTQNQVRNVIKPSLSIKLWINHDFVNVFERHLLCTSAFSICYSVLWADLYLHLQDIYDHCSCSAVYPWHHVGVWLFSVWWKHSGDVLHLHHTEQPAGGADVHHALLALKTSESCSSHYQDAEFRYKYGTINHALTKY